uniref:Uncharacterized protein n=1 Tax=Strongyloides stercoralis TaxID=6248 RepID=A0A0K0DSZ0_STRER
MFNFVKFTVKNSKYNKIINNNNNIIINCMCSSICNA